MLARKSEEDLKRQAEALASDNLRLNGIAEKLQTERSQLQRTVLGLEASPFAGISASFCEGSARVDLKLRPRSILSFAG